MNMFKKLVSLTLCVFVALGAVACGSAPASGPEPSPSASGSTSESQATSEVEGEKDENGMYAVYPAYPNGTDCDHCNLFFAVNRTGKQWETFSRPILKPSTEGGWDDFCIYRLCPSRFRGQ